MEKKEETSRQIETKFKMKGEYKSCSSSLCSFSLPSLFGPNILLSTLFSNTLSLCSSLTVRDHVPRPYKTTGKVTVLYILTFTFFVADEKTEVSGSNGIKHY
jgi:hypothetical protein